TGTNPLVGCVIVHNDTIIGEGYHEVYGGPHAEVNAIHAVKNPELLKESTVYVNLEPCAHFGKTPPCCDLLIARGIKEVVIAMADPFPKVNGEGIRRLQAAGCRVQVGLLEDEARELNKRFLCYHEKKRPFIILKWMQSADGFIGRKNERLQLSNAFSSRKVHQWRSEEAAILIGPDTAINDNPTLTTRLAPGKNPVRILLDRFLRVPDDLILFRDEYPLWILNTRKEGVEGKRHYLKVAGARFLENGLTRLYEEGIASVLVEGGAEIHRAFIGANLWDEARIGVSPIELHEGVPAPEWPGVSMKTTEIQDDTWYFIQALAKAGT
ncbi:MAG: bifunctional diaminohydroxyphosphoribosylaminopyrimidine deaminase/5-amino-6-(5-phosphoribosylamino)uracil reductase RibD, partial [Bacteroidia bacterium]